MNHKDYIKNGDEQVSILALNKCENLADTLNRNL